MSISRRLSSGPLLPIAFVLLWSTGFIGADLGTRYAGAITLLTWRLTASALLLIGVCALTGRRVRKADLRRHVPLGLLMQFGYLTGCFLGVQLGVPAATAALIAALQPIVVTALATLTLGQRVSRRGVLGLAVGLGGVALVVGDGLGAAGGPAWAFLLPAAGMLLLATGTVLSRRSPETSDVVTSLCIQMSTAALAFLVLAVATGQLAPPRQLGFVGALAWLVLLAGFGGYGTYLMTLRRHGPAVASVLLYLTPPTTLLATAAMFGEPIRAHALVGMALSALGVALFLAPGRRGRNSSSGVQRGLTVSR